ncbi:MAG: NAD(P)/FAD-dependent oxidoreductase [Bifidobacterium tibiigranuli]|uniref:NAD(P)/FAD-dependent oxidoreductase n=1 Tax=Bifidobacterium tibiigranuli TaxID=2172043 RepID=UPI002356A96F|nr:NAD(P)/FAD-dependent oxidoreductase [Bifidobacterium tibiigranuli]MCH4190111.1 NAD(P)/FAD-dependent oxidoreductase [Bifidobacterium tibiigranuli]MCH4203134.1 NAD(P)/FAD-dependent oxidoreductase [Bifidobacterium tibiigranuli]MCH4274717.1 NAD(P)/FAD-dependent oxidoreductase [Bifidobacterium tibiigranuli]
MSNHTTGSPPAGPTAAEPLADGPIDAEPKPALGPLHDVAVIGAGPVGMFAAAYCAMRNLDTQLIESLPQLGGQVAALYPEKKIHDIAGFVSGTGGELVENLSRQLDLYGEHIEIHCNAAVRDLHRLPDGTFVLDTGASAFHTRAVLIAVGAGAFAPRALPIAYDHTLDGHGVFYFVKHLADFAGKTVAVAGGGDAALDWALELEPYAQQVFLVHRRDTFRALESSVERLRASSVEARTPYKFTSVTAAGAAAATATDFPADFKSEFTIGSETGSGTGSEPGTGGTGSGATLHLGLEHLKSKEPADLEVDALLVNYGFTSDNHVLRDWGLPVTRGDLIVDEHLQTSFEGIYGVGDAVTYPGKVKLISVGFGEVPRAVNHLAEALYPDRKQPLHD